MTGLREPIRIESPLEDVLYILECPEGMVGKNNSLMKSRSMRKEVTSVSEPFNRKVVVENRTPSFFPYLFYLTEVN